MAGVFPSSACMHLRDKCKHRLPWKPATAAEKKNEIYRFLIRFFLFFKTQLQGEEATEADKDAWNVTGPSHKGSYDGFVKGFCMH